MKIEYLGHSCFCLTTEIGKKIITDPYQGVGYCLPDGLSADIVTVSHEHFDHNAVHCLQSVTSVVKESGTHFIDGITFHGLPTWHDDKQGKLRGKNTIYIIEADGLSVAHLGDLGEENNLALIQALKDIDILLIPVGGTYTITAEQAKRYIEQISPKVAVPMHYLPNDGTLDIAKADAFLSLFEDVAYATEDGILLDKDVFTKGKTQIIFMERGKKIWAKRN